MNLVSVIIPCHNCEKWVARAVNSVLSQTYSANEILLIENNSTDNTLEILNDFEKTYPDKIKVYSEKKKGAAAARNLGISKAKGEWIQFLDADDELLPEKIEKQIAIINRENPDLIIDDYCKIHAGRKVRPSENIKAQDDPWLGVINSRLGITSANLWKKEKLVAINGWDENLISSQEYDMLFRLLKLPAKIVVSHEINTLIHAQPESISRTANPEKIYKLILNRYNLRKQIYNYLIEKNLLNSDYKRNLNFYLYYHLLLISEFDMAYFKDQFKLYDFQEINLKNRLHIYIDFIRHSSKRKYGYSSLYLKLPEWQIFFFKNIFLLKY